MLVNEKLFIELKSFVTKTDINYDAIRQIYVTNITEDESKFDNFWDTFGYFLANIPTNYDLLHHAKNWTSPTHYHLIKSYLLRLAKEDNLNRFKKNRDLGRSGYYILFLEDFDEALEASFRFENSFFENYGFGNYAAAYASSLLLSTDVSEFVDLLRTVKIEMLNRQGKEILSEKPILRVAAILFTDLAKKIFWGCETSIIDNCLKSDVMPLRALAISGISTYAVNHKNKITFDKVEKFFSLLSFNEEVKAYIALLHQTRFNKIVPQEELLKNCFDKLLQLLTVKDSNIIFNAVEQITSNKYFELIEAYATNNLLIPLLNMELITTTEIHDFWRSKFEKELCECEATSKNTGVIDLAGWVIYITKERDGRDFAKDLVKTAKKSLFTLRKPFMRGTSTWEKEYNKLLMMQTVASISMKYLKSTENIPEDLRKNLNFLIDEITVIKVNYPNFKEYSNIHIFNKQIVEE